MSSIVPYTWILFRLVDDAIFGGNVGFRRLQKADSETFDQPFRTDENRLRAPLLLAYRPTAVPHPDDWSTPHAHIIRCFF
jgi:hypothetical protein